jgi:hypothetical protein
MVIASEAWQSSLGPLIFLHGFESLDGWIAASQAPRNDK